MSSVDCSPYQQRDFAINRWRQRADKYEMHTQSCQERYNNEYRIRRDADRTQTAQLMQRINENARTKKGNKLKPEAIRAKSGIDNPDNDVTYSMNMAKAALKRKMQSGCSNEMQSSANGFMDSQQQQKKLKTDLENEIQNDPTIINGNTTMKQIKQEKTGENRSQVEDSQNTDPLGLLGDDDLLNEIDWKNLIDTIAEMDEAPTMDKQGISTAQSQPPQPQYGTQQATPPHSASQQMHCKQEKVDMMQHGFHGNRIKPSMSLTQIPRPNLPSIMNQQSIPPNMPSHNFNGNASINMPNQQNMSMQNHPNYNMPNGHRGNLHSQQNNVLTRQNAITHGPPPTGRPNQPSDVQSMNMNNNTAMPAHNMTSQHIQRLNNVSVNSQFSPPPAGCSEPPRLFHPPSNQGNGNGSQSNNYYQSSQQLKHLAEKQWTGGQSHVPGMQQEMGNQYNRGAQYRGPTPPLQTQRLSHMEPNSYSHQQQQQQIMMSHRSSSAEMMRRQSSTMSSQMQQHPTMMSQQRSSSLNQSYPPQIPMPNTNFPGNRQPNRMMPTSQPNHNFPQSQAQHQSHSWSNQHNSWNHNSTNNNQMHANSMPPQMQNMNAGYPQNFPQLDIDTQNTDDLRLLDEIISK